jgi:glycosyltransferase involved in cell wall biosynthesis
MIDATSSALPMRTIPVRRNGRATDVVRRGPSPAFGFILVGGALSGAQVRDVRLANELVRRGFPVHVWWAMDRPHKSPLDPAISQRWLFNAARYGGWLRQAAADDFVGQWICRLTPDSRRQQIVQTFPSILDRQLRGLIRAVCAGVSRDKRLIRRFAAELSQSQVTHVLPNLECLAPFAAAARQYVSHPLSYLMTFQGYELYAGYTRDARQLAALYARLAEAVEQSDWPAIAVSDAYGARICSDVGLEEHDLTTIPAGVPVDEPMDAAQAATLVRERFPEYRPEIPLVSFVGRRDSEKGIDLLLYAARILQARGVPLQLAICGPTAFGNQYVEACRQIAWNMRVPVLWSDYVSDELRSALFRTSRTVVYPSIHEEPFGMVPVEAMAQGTPALVPDSGGVADLIYAAGCQGGLRFRSWDSGDLAQQLERLLTDTALHARLAADAPLVADHFSVERMGERILDHLGLPHRNAAL